MVRDSSLHRENRHHWDRICCEKLDNFFKFFFFKFFFFSSYFLSFVFWVFFESDGKIEINNKKNWAGNFFFWKIWNFFFILVRCFFFLVTTFKFGLFSSFFIGSAAKTTNSILNFFQSFFFAWLLILFFSIQRLF